MEGTLWKWTNYFSGWQPRWFVLESGILSYYRAQEDVNNGCKGSIKMSVCDVSVHPTDNTRLDLSIPGEAHFYVKAATPQERQEWLIALGSCKAGQAHSPPPIQTITIPDEDLKAKKSELRLYCDLLMQQVHSVKSAVKSDTTPNVQLCIRKGSTSEKSRNMPKHKDLTSDESSEDSDYEPTKKKGKKSSPQKAEKSKAPPSGIGEVSFQLSANRWVSVSEFRKKVFVNIREYYDADGEMKPGRKGIALNMAQWKNLKSHMDEIDKTLEDYE